MRRPPLSVLNIFQYEQLNFDLNLALYRTNEFLKDQNCLKPSICLSLLMFLRTDNRWSLGEHLLNIRVLSGRLFLSPRQFCTPPL